MEKKGSSRPFDKARVARLAAVQAIYQMDQTGDTASRVINDFIQHRFITGDYPAQVDTPLFRVLVETGAERAEDIQDLIRANLNDNWPYDRLEAVLLAILKCATGELLTMPSKAPAPVVINEYVDICSGFFASQEPGFVNAYLDRIARSLSLVMTKEH